MALGFPSPSPLSPYHGGRGAETEWGPIRGSATQNWFEKFITKMKKLQMENQRFLKIRVIRVIRDNP